MTLYLAESDMEQIICKHPELIEEGLVLVGRQVSVDSLRVDLLFKDRFGETLVVELKRGTIKREHVGQIMDYVGTLYDGKPLRLMLVGNRVPFSFRKALDYHGIEWREISEKRLLQFLDGHTTAPIKGYHNLARLFEDFRKLKNLYTGEGIVEKSVEDWCRIRKAAKAKYAMMFHPTNLENLTEEDFISFLYFRNNRAWTNLYRRGLGVVKDMTRLRKLIAFLQDESVDIKMRISSVLRGGSLHITGMGKNLATGILHVCDEEDRYGVWNNRTESALKKLERLPRRTWNQGEFYWRINQRLNALKKELNTDLVIVDSFLWHVDKVLPTIQQRRDESIRKKLPQLAAPFPKVEVSEDDRRKMFNEITSFEEQMVAFLVKTLRGFFSENWVKQGIPREIRKQWLERRNADIKEGIPPETLLINYADFSDYKEIILHNWKKMFFQHFKDKEKLRVRLDDLNNLVRKKTMHPRRTMYKDEIGAGKIAIRWIKSKIQ